MINSTQQEICGHASMTPRKQSYQEPLMGVALVVCLFVCFSIAGYQ